MHRFKAIAKEARQREVGRAVKAYMEKSESRRRDEHGPRVPIEELIRRKQVGRRI